MDEAVARERLTDEQRRVEGLVEDLRAELGDAQGTGELADYDQHPADTATDTFEREKDLAILEQLEPDRAWRSKSLRVGEQKLAVGVSLGRGWRGHRQDDPVDQSQDSGAVATVGTAS